MPLNIELDREYAQEIFDAGEFSYEGGMMGEAQVALYHALRDALTTPAPLEFPDEPRCQDPGCTRC